ncbi:MAG: SseB family protein [Roseburia sp.]|nr:SseB family protein [Roseburia sp.]MCM1097947.1 SseB family protein [Ruminococcus flavefaciens]
MEFNKVVSNPMLVGCVQLMRAEDTPEHRSMFVGELTKALLQAPALIDPAPAEDGEGRLTVTPGSRIQFPMLSTPDGKRFYMGFTDPVEYNKWAERNNKPPFFALRLDDYLNMMFRRDSQGNENPALGLVLNPLGDNIVIPREMLAGIMAAKMGQMQQILSRKAGAAAQKQTGGQEPNPTK